MIKPFQLFSKKEHPSSFLQFSVILYRTIYTTMKTSILILSLILSLGAFAQNCIPATVTGDGLHPDPNTNPGLPVGSIGNTYETIITIKVPMALVVDLSAQIGFPTPPVGTMVNTLTLNNPIGLPNGLSQSCFPSTCVMNGGTTGCIVFSGTPTSSGVSQVIVTGSYNVSVPAVVPFIGGTALDLPTANLPYTLVINTSNASIEVLEGNHSWLMVPNPSHGTFAVIGDVKNGESFTIFNTNGQAVDSFTISGAGESLSVNLDAGVYFVQKELAAGSSIQRLVIE